MINKKKSALRTKQKEKREISIIEAAKQLFGEKGYRNTSIEEIAQKAEVGPATVYNYFNSKSGIFLAIFRTELEVMLQKGSQVIANLPETAEDAVLKLAETYFCDLPDRYSKKLVREIFSFVISDQVSAGDEIRGLDNLLINQLVGMLKVFETRRQFAQGISSADVAFIVFPLIMTDLMTLFVKDEMTTQDFRKSLQRHLKLAFNGLKA